MFVMCVLRFFVLYMRDGWVGEFGGGVRVD